VSRDNAYVLACLSRWLEAEGLAAEELTADHLERFHVTVQPANSGKASTQLA
jgi:hypothetical protein